MFKERLHAVDQSLQKIAKLSSDALDLAIDAYDNRSEYPPDVVEFEDAANDLRKSCLTFIALEHPVATDLKFAMAALRVGQDYERIFDLSTSLWKRISGDGKNTTNSIRQIKGDAATAVCTAATAVKSFHAIISECRFGMTPENWAFIEKAGREYQILTKMLVENAQEKIIDVMDASDIPAEHKVELVLAARHIKRIVSLMFDIIQEFRSIKDGSS